MQKILSVLDVLLTPLVNILPANARKYVYASVPVVLGVLDALNGSGLLSGTAAIIVGAVYSGLSGLTAAANTVVPAKATKAAAPPVAPAAK